MKRITTTQPFKKKSAFAIKYSRLERKSFPFIYILIAFPVLQFVVFWFFVNLSSIALAFQDSEGLWSLASFRDVFAAIRGADKWGFSLLEMAGRSLQIFVLQHILLFGVNVILSFILVKKMPGHKIMRLCYALPGIVGAVVFASIMKSFYSFDGLFVNLTNKLGIKLPEMVIRNGFLGASKYGFNTMKMQIMVLGFTGGNLILSGAYLRIPKEIFEAANIDGVGFWREIFRIAIPCIGPTIVTFTVFGLCSLLTSDYGAYLYTNGTGEPDMSTISFYLYFLQVRIAQYNQTAYYSYAAAFGLVITFVTIPVVLLGLKLLNRYFEPVEF